MFIQMYTAFVHQFLVIFITFELITVYKGNLDNINFITKIYATLL